MTRIVSINSLRRNVQYRRAWYCTARKHGLVRVFPFDTYERATEGPVLGKSGEAILLSSLNNSRAMKESGLAWAWCWACEKWVQASRMTQEDLLVAYYRAGVSIRVDQRAASKVHSRRAQGARNCKS
jgi:hypothetical protein